MPLTVANQRIVNPTSGVSYRLKFGSESWPITRSAPVGSVISLVHLKGTELAEVINQLVPFLFRDDPAKPLALNRRYRRSKHTDLRLH